MVESGSHAELMRQGGLYHRLMREQAATLARPADAQADAQADARTDMADAGVARAQTLTGHAGAPRSPAVSASTPVSTTVTRDPREDGRDEPDLDNPQAPARALRSIGRRPGGLARHAGHAAVGGAAPGAAR